MEDVFAKINGHSYRVGDWVKDTRVDYSDFYSLIVQVFEDRGNVNVVIREPDLTYLTISVLEFADLVRAGVLTYQVKPKYSIGQEFKNRFTEETLEIIYLPYDKNDIERDYVYFVRKWDVQTGYNFVAMKEKDIHDYYQTVGVELV